ncbi:MAG: AzlD domain-containing protein [Candidatus Accumulibacter sp.]|uniref:AzlD family protein n=1 Tax=Accumulibacter sp. TaxID=2053492 RepID=UPI0019FBAB8C|nr:AzlD domain-containing protein [Accumulibacter sp.]MBE2258277.1 AzlD domain-containing protein [Paracoccaceae bacterium]MCB1942759.1 AzlD domain-containing protein [Accumulibacter sp.]MCP5247114.1 AzlD domain-containing protein [Accumulibacter sp.]
MNDSLVTIAAIIGMALATWLTRVGGLFLMKGVTVKGRLKAALDALPPAVLMAVIAPTVLATGTAETLAAAITAMAALLRLPMIAVVAIGVAAVVALRAVL